MSNIATPEMIAAAWDAWKSRPGWKLGPGPAFREAIEAALSVRSKEPELEHHVIADLAARLAKAERERDELRHDVERHIAASSSEADRAETAESKLAKAERERDDIATEIAILRGQFKAQQQHDGALIASLSAKVEDLTRALEEANDWRPMESAPRDGTEILAAIEVHNTTGRKWWERHVISFDECRNEIGLDYDHGWSWEDYIRWRPLPSPPKEGE